MVSQKDMKRLLKGGHPTDESLLLYLDGELRQRKAGQIRSHLEGCWDCRLRRQVMEQAITTFMQCRRDEFRQVSGNLRDRERQFRARLERLAAERGPAARSWFHRRRRISSPGDVRLVFLFITALVLVAWINSFSITAVSAKEVLDHARMREVGRLHEVRDPVVYQKVLVRRKATDRGPEQTATLQLWNSRGQMRQSAESELWKKLQDVLTSNRMGDRPLLSPAAYDSWRGSVRVRNEETRASVLPDGRQVLSIRTAVERLGRTNNILEAEYCVSRRDWQPISEDLRVETENNDIAEYELTEVEASVLPRSAVESEIRGEKPAELTLRHAMEPNGKRVLSPPAIPEPGVAKVSAAEVEALYALHRAGACRGESIQVVRDGSGSVLVRGVVENAARKMEIVTGLHEVPLVKVDVRAVEEFVRQPSDTAPVREPGRPTGAIEVRSQRLPIEDYLRSGSAADVARLSNDALSLARSGLKEAWALRRLVAVTGPKPKADLDPASRWLLEIMIRDHAAPLKTHVARFRILLEPILAPIIRDAGITSLPDADHFGLRVARKSQDEGWTPACLTVVASVEQIDRWVQCLFAGGGVQTSEVSQSISGLLSSVQRAEREIKDLEEQVAREFAGRTLLNALEPGPADDVARLR
jgi:hypothetical protein